LYHGRFQIEIESLNQVNEEMDLKEADFKLLGEQLRKPDGEMGIQVGEAMNSGNAAMNLHSIAIVNPSPDDLILEIGMGNGYFVKNILNIDPTISYIGYDYSMDMVKESEKLNGNFVKQGKAKFIQGDIASIPFQGESITKIFSVNTIYFWEDTQKVMQDLKRLLQSNGELTIAFRPKKNMEQFPVTEFGFNFFTKEEVKELFEKSGFKSIEVTHIYEPEEEIFGKNLIKENVVIKGVKQ